MAASVVIVEDDDAIGTLLEASFKVAGFQTRLCDRALKAETMALESQVDLMVLDWVLPGLSGLQLCRRMRSNRLTERMPILVLSARAEEDDRIQVFDAGADDYLKKPFSVQELIARSKALLRRAAADSKHGILTSGDIMLNPDTHRVTRRDRDVHLSPNEYRLLELLLGAPDQVHTRTQILRQVWGHGEDFDERVVDAYVARLRRALNAGSAKNVIRTVRGVGYALR